jgi:uncharacterized damage-inducible protein DinB
MVDALLETWQIHDRINRYLLDAIPDEALSASLPKCRNISSLLAHVHNVRLQWIQAAAPELLAGLDKLDTKAVVSKPELRKALEASGQAIEKLARKSLDAGGRVKGFKPHAVAFLGYLISHESHHRGQIGWTLKQSGHPLPPKIAFGLWEWGVR